MTAHLIQTEDGQGINVECTVCRTGFAIIHNNDLSYHFQSDGSGTPCPACAVFIGRFVELLRDRQQVPDGELIV